MSERLKPCPWCGAKAQLAEDHNGFYVDADHTATADGDECPFGIISWRDDPFYGRMSADRLAAAWNRRPTEDALLAACEAIERAISDGKASEYNQATAISMGVTKELDLLRAAIAAATGEMDTPIPAPGDGAEEERE